MAIVCIQKNRQGQKILPTPLYPATVSWKWSHNVIHEYIPRNSVMILILEVITELIIISCQSEIVYLDTKVDRQISYNLTTIQSSEQCLEFDDMCMML